MKTPNQNGKLIKSLTLYDDSINEIKKYFNREYFNTNKDNIIGTQEKELQFVKSQCDKANRLLSEIDKSLEINDFEQAKKILEKPKYRVNDKYFETEAEMNEYLNGK